MRIRRVIEVKVQTCETFVLRPSQMTVVATCTECGAEVEMLTAGAAAAHAGVPLRWIYRWIESGQLHFQETSAGLVLICPNSLQATARSHAGKPGSTTKKLEER